MIDVLKAFWQMAVWWVLCLIAGGNLGKPKGGNARQCCACHFIYDCIIVGRGGYFLYLRVLHLQAFLKSLSMLGRFWCYLCLSS